MSAVEALQAARNAGIGLHVDGDGLVLEASAPPPDEVFDLLSRQKAGVIAQLKRDRDGWSAEDWQVLFDERAGLIDFDGGLPRAQAEARAFACCLAEWMSRNPAPLPPVRCFGCGAVEHMHDPLLPFGIDSTGHAWLLSRCWPAWYAGRKAETVAALAAMGITAPAELPDDFEKKTDARRDGRLRIGTAKRFRARLCGSLPFNRRKPAAQGRLSSASLVGQLAMDVRQRKGRLDQSAGRSGPAASLLSGAHRRRRVGGRCGTVRIVRLPCRFGGARPYFICPGVVNGVACGRRVAKLHGPDRLFLCRHCYRLAHASQSEGAWDRALRRANKIRQRVGGDPGMAAPFPQKPKGMRCRTYERLREQALEAEMLAEESFAIRAGRLLARIENPKRKRKF